MTNSKGSKRPTAPAAPSLHPRVAAVAQACFLLVAIGAGLVWTLYLLKFLSAGSAGQLDGRAILVGIVFLLATALAVAGSLALMIMQRNPDTLPRARKVARFTIAMVVVSMAFAIFGLGLNPVLLVYAYMLCWLIYFQLATDPNLDRSRGFHDPWVERDAEKRRGYIRLNFFNLFWVFVVASILGLYVEEIFHALTIGGYQDRAGLMWGPFSPIYGFGAALMTIALNRFWKKPLYVLFLISGLIGCAFEFWVSFFLQTAFGILAWNYAGTFLNIDGRTNFAAFCAWGFLGMVWVRLLLPGLLRLVDAIPLNLRTVVTVLSALFMVVNSMVTLVALDCWYQRSANIPQTSALQQFMATNFDNEVMQNRFQAMDMNADTAGRIDT